MPITYLLAFDRMNQPLTLQLSKHSTDTALMNSGNIFDRSA